MNSAAPIMILLTAISIFAQSEGAYESTEEKKSGLFDLSRLTVHNSLSFGAMSGSGASGLKSQSLYSTMMQYRFNAPVTLNLNFGLPIHSTFSPSRNLSAGNLQSLDYFKSMPIEMSLYWQPSKNTLFQLSVQKSSWDNGYYSGYFNDMYPWSPVYRSER